ncbi:MAG: hypothetical protein IIZ28_05610 [Erysipelotrichaceae bacterium]|nr:hypothetical protein [Erysipelotrichaceae bacterium]
MKKLLAVLLLLTALCGCAEQDVPAVPAAEDRVVLQVNVEGIGHVAAAEGDQTPEIDPGFPTTSHALSLPKGSTVTLLGYRIEGDWDFVKWTKDGVTVSRDEQLTVTVDEDTEYVAVFMMTGGYEGESVDKIDDAVTMGDILGLPSYSSTCSEEEVIQVFELNDRVYRAVARIDSDQAAALFDLDILDPNYDSDYAALVAPLAIDHIVDLTEKIPTEADLEQYKGKSGQELLDEGWQLSFLNTETMDARMDHGYYSYDIKFEGGSKNDPDMDMEEMIKDWKIASIAYEGIGSCAADPGLD